MKRILTQERSRFTRVFVRVRPLFGRERQYGSQAVVKVDRDKALVQITDPDGDGSADSFAYHATFGPTNTTREMYEQEVAMVVADVLNGKLGKFGSSQHRHIHRTTFFLPHAFAVCIQCYC